MKIWGIKANFAIKFIGMRKMTLLLGAGAAIPWEAPNTQKITESIRNTTDHIIGNETFGNWIHNLLLRNSNSSPNGINFETYVDFIESVHGYLRSTSTVHRNLINSSYKLFDLKNEINEGLDILKWSNGSYFGADNVLKIGSALDSFIRIIGNQIIPYLNNYAKDDFKQLNERKLQFIEHFINAGFSVRAYTLNYDRSIPLIFETYSTKHEFFDGFDIKSKINVYNKEDLYISNKTRILSDSQCHCFYNLHGSFHWSFQESGYKRDSNPFPFTLMSTKQFKDILSRHVQDQPTISNPNEMLQQFPIITGYKKSQRITLDPFNYFFHNFFSDMHQSEIIIIVGYSFFDPHINQLLRKAMKENVRIYSIGFHKITEVESKSGYIHPEGFVLKNYYPVYTNWFRDVGSNYLEYPFGFERFLLDEECFNIQPL